MLLCCLSFFLDSSMKSRVPPLSAFRYTGNLLTSFLGFESLCLNPRLFCYSVEDALQSNCMAVMLGLPVALLEFSYTLDLDHLLPIFSLSLLAFVSCFHGAFASFLYSDQYVRSAADREERFTLVPSFRYPAPLALLLWTRVEHTPWWERVVGQTVFII